MNKIYVKYIKRILDVIISLSVLILFSWLYLILIILVKIKLGSPVIFRQPRPGIIDIKTGKERIFNLYKFRSMTDEKDQEGNLLSDSIRLTAFGKKLRSTSLDELPEFLNILKGDMSLVGPRPQLIKDLIFMNENQRKRHVVLPGLTGLAQINGRNAVSWDDKFKYDLEYVNDISFINDLKIVLKTFYKVIKKEDIVQEGYDTAEDYGDYLLRINKISSKEYNEKIEEIHKWKNIVF